MTWLVALNFLVLQWFGVRLERVFVTVQTGMQPDHVSLDDRGAVSLGWACETRRVQRGWRLRWVWPLTGWGRS